ncbi:MAG TPA: hypothetical protein VFB69_00005 [Candidatus Dormibacteraeota bacterium]|nr:hypothetical protein [Candidatus Dormibacteraeota bacterium]
MAEILRQSASHRVELDEDVSVVHQPHKSWGTYRVIDAMNDTLLFESPNRDKAFGVFEYLTAEALVASRR